MTSVAINQGVTGQFAVQQDYGVLPEGAIYVCDSVASRGYFVQQTAQGICSLVSGDMPATGILLGFLEQDVVADNSLSIQFGYTVQQQGATVGGSTVSGDLVTIHRFGRFFVTAVSGTVATGAKIYPQNGGLVGSTQIGSAPAIGQCVISNGGVAGNPIVMEVNLIGRLAL